MRDAPQIRPIRPSRHGGAIPAQIALTAAGGALLIAASGTVLAGDAAGMTAGIAAYLLVCGAVTVLMGRSYPHHRIGGCNAVTLLRAALTCALLAPLVTGQAAGWAVAGVAGTALVLDGVDGHLARRSGLVSRFGARFDMEVDAALALVLSLHVIAGTVVGPEILVLGLARYGFVLAGTVLPWMRADLPDRRWRKVICVIQIAALILLQLPVLTPDQAIWLARIAALLVIASFATDIRWLWMRRP